MGNFAVSKANQDGVTVKYQYLTDGAATWSALVDVTSTYLDETKSLTGTASGLTSFANDLVEAERYIVYYDVATLNDKFVDSNVTQKTGLTWKIYADDVAIDAIPTTLLATQAQSANAYAKDSRVQLVSFADTTKTAFMVEISGISGFNGGQGVDLLTNGDFESGTFSPWTATAGTTIEESDSGFLPIGTIPSGAGLYYARIDGSFTQEENINQDVDTTAVSTDMEMLLTARIFIVDGTATLTVSGGALSYTILEADEGTVISKAFTFDSAETTLNVDFSTALGTSNALNLDNVTLNVTDSTPVYVGAPLDHRRLFFGVQIFTPDTNFSNGATADNSAKFNRIQTGNSNYSTRTNSTRSDTIAMSLQTDDMLQQVEHISYKLNGDYCFYQRDSASTDERNYFIANFYPGSADLDFDGINSVPTITFQELSAR